MTDDLDQLLALLRNEPLPAPHETDRVIWQEFHRRQQVNRAILSGLQRNIGIAAMALLIGIAVSVNRPASIKPVSIGLLLTEVPPESLLE